MSTASEDDREEGGGTFIMRSQGERIKRMWPPWPPSIATAYVLAGIMIQGWFCCGAKGPLSIRRLLAQIATGVVYIAALVAAPGHLIQT